MVFFLRKSGANIVVRVVDVVVEVTIVVDIPRVVGVVAVRRTTIKPLKKSCAHLITNSYMFKAFLQEL